jgi:hypothetical protein
LEVNMSVPLPRSRALWLVLALFFAIAGAVSPSAMAHDDRGALYTQTNDPAGNTVQKFDRAADGSLSPAGTFATGGAGLATLGGLRRVRSLPAGRQRGRPGQLVPRRP